MSLSRALQVVYKRLHAVQARLVERLQNVQRSKQERPRATGGIKDRHCGNGLVERSQQLRPFAGSNDVFGELADIEVVGNQAIDLVHCASLELVAQFQTALPELRL